MTYYVKREVFHRAAQWTGDNAHEVANLLDEGRHAPSYTVKKGVLTVFPEEGALGVVIERGFWLVVSHEGCKVLTSQEFEARYEEASTA